MEISVKSSNSSNYRGRVSGSERGLAPSSLSEVRAQLQEHVYGELIGI